MCDINVFQSLEIERSCQKISKQIWPNKLDEALRFPEYIRTSHFDERCEACFINDSTSSNRRPNLHKQYKQ